MKDNKNYIVINGGEPIALTEAQVEGIKKSLNHSVCLKSVEPGEPFVYCGIEFIVLDHKDGKTLIITKDLVSDGETFGSSNNFADDNCNVRKVLEKFMQKLNKDDLVKHTVDLTSDDGLKDYGTTETYVSLLTCEQYRKYVEILDKHKPNKWWWLATPFSTPTHEDADWVKCVSPRGNVISDDCSNNSNGVRPFCILKSNIFVSK